MISPSWFRKLFARPVNRPARKTPAPCRPHRRGPACCKRPEQSSACGLEPANLP